MGDTRRIREPKHLYQLPFEQEALEVRTKQLAEKGSAVISDEDREIMKRYGFQMI